MISSIIRCEARCKFVGEQYNYAALHERLITAMDRPGRQADVRIGFFDAATLSNVSAAFDEFARQHPAHGTEPLVEER
jgi:hypothetical protein